MTFLHPMLALAGAAAVGIPILIHLLFRQRRKPVPWAAMRFLLEALRKQRRRLRLETLLLLAVRCLLVACLGAAIARPLLSGSALLGASNAGRDVYLLIDNSIASAVRPDDSSDVTTLARHLETARAVADGLLVGDRLGIVTLGGPPEGLVVPASPDARAAASLLDSVKPTDSAADLAGAAERVAAAIRSQRAGQSSGAVRHVVVYLISDFTTGSADLTRPLPALFQGLDHVRLVVTPPSSRPTPNVQIVGLEPLRGVVLSGGATGDAPGAEQASQVRVSLRRSGPAVASASVSTVRVSTSLSGAISPTAASAAVRWTPGQSTASVTLQLEADASITSGAGSAGRAGRDAVLVAELDRDALASDNVRRRPIEVRDRLQVGVIAPRSFGGSGRPDQLSSAEWFRLALRPSDSSPIEVIDIEPAAVDAPALASLDAVILPAPDLLKGDAWQRIRRFVEGGGLVIVSPPENVTVHLWADAFTSALGLNWTIAREASAAAPDSPARLAEIAPGVVPGSGSDGGTIFALLSQELQQLARPVTITRWLNVTLAPTGAVTPTQDPKARSTGPEGGHGQNLLSLAQGPAWLIASRLGAPSPDPSGATASSAHGAGRGLIVMLASAPVLAWTDLPARPLMVPLVQELIRQGVGEAGDTLTAVAGRTVVLPPGTVELRAPDAVPSGTSDRIAVAESGQPSSPVRAAGVWRAQDNAGRTRGILVVNPDPDGALLDPQPQDAVRTWLQSLVRTSGTADAGAQPPETADAASITFLESGAASRSVNADAPGGKSMWTLPLFVAALLLALVEVALARWFSHASVDTTASGQASPPVAPTLDDLLGLPGHDRGPGVAA